jgi:hypothetical protein
VDEKVQAVKEILDQDRENVERLQPAHEELVQALTKVGTAMYAAADAAGAAAGAGPDGFATNGAAEGGAAGEAEDETTVAGEFREADSEREGTPMQRARWRVALYRARRCFVCCSLCWSLHAVPFRPLGGWLGSRVAKCFQPDSAA